MCNLEQHSEPADHEDNGKKKRITTIASLALCSWRNSASSSTEHTTVKRHESAVLEGRHSGGGTACRVYNISSTTETRQVLGRCFKNGFMELEERWDAMTKCMGAWLLPYSTTHLPRRAALLAAGRLEPSPGHPCPVAAH